MTPKEFGEARSAAWRSLRHAAERWVKDPSPENTSALREASIEETKIWIESARILQARALSRKRKHLRVVNLDED